MLYRTLCIATLALCSCSESGANAPVPGDHVFVKFEDGQAASGTLEALSAEWLVIRLETPQVTQWYPARTVRMIEVKD